MNKKILNYLKRIGLFFIAQPLSHWLGMMVSGILGITAAFILKEDYLLYASIIEYGCLFTIPFISLFFMVQYFTGYDEETRFRPTTAIVSLAPLFITQWIYLFIWGPAFWLHGICSHISMLWLPKHTELWPDVVVLLGLQLLVYLPIYLIASRCGYNRKNKEESYSE